MPDINSLFPSKYLRNADLPESGHKVVTIRTIRVEDVGQGDEKESKPVLHFFNDVAPMVLNKTNAAILSDLLGSDYEKWADRRVALHRDRVAFQGKMVDCIRVATRLPQTEQRSEAQQEQPPF